MNALAKPNILEVIRGHVELRHVGRHWRGLCPFHAEKTPSFTVNENKGRFKRFGCGVGGDVIKFVELIDNVSLKQALSRLGIENRCYRPKPLDSRKKRAALLLAGWLCDQSRKVGSLLRELSQDIWIAEKIPDPELKESLENEWLILSDLHDDLARPEFAAEIFAARESIEAITADAPVEALLEFPPLTEADRAYIAANLPESPC